MAKATHECPLCRGTGNVTASVACAKIVVRDREKYNETMREVNRRARKKAKDVDEARKLLQP